MRTFIKILALLFLLALFLVACIDRTKPSNKTTSDLIEKRIGKSQLYITIPKNYKIDEKVGPDFTVYYFEPSDSTNEGIGSAGLYLGGFPSPFGPDTITCKTETINSKLLDKNARWTIYSCDKMFSAETIVPLSEYEKAHAFISTKTRKDADSLIKLFEALKEK